MRRISSFNWRCFDNSIFYYFIFPIIFVLIFNIVLIIARYRFFPTINDVTNDDIFVVFYNSLERIRISLRVIMVRWKSGWIFLRTLYFIFCSVDSVVDFVIVLTLWSNDRDRNDAFNWFFVKTLSFCSSTIKQLFFLLFRFFRVELSNAISSRKLQNLK